jgi:two-component system sensor histidine kinase ChiS
VNLSELLIDHWHEYSDEERYKNMKIISQSGKRLLMVMNSILDLSKFTSGKMSMKMTEGNLENSVREMIAECETLYLHQNKDVVIETNIQEGLDTTVIMDPERIAQVLRNLVGNAVKFTKVGKIKISLRNQGKNLEVIVEDEGVGIPEEELEDIFNPFVQSSKTKSNAGGTGLGLSICKEIITAHNGKIWAVNKIIGSSFHFIIPRAKNIETPVPQVKSKIADKPSHQTKGTALMIDDDELCHNIISMILKNDGYEMISTYSGAEGLEYLHQHYKEIDFIFLDLMMPHMNGLEVLKKIKSEESLAHIPVIIQSASSNNDDYNKAVELGAIGFFAKPYERKNIIKFVDNLVDDVEEETT